jgi:hypothetical protein
MLKGIVFRRFLAALVLALFTASPLLAQHAPLSLCLVETKPNTWTQYDPPAGPWAAELDKMLSAQKLRSGAPLEITVLAALAEKDVPPEVRRLRCPWVVQLRYHGSFWPGGRYEGDDEDSILFSLWNGATGKTIADGASLIRPFAVKDRLASNAVLAAPCAALTRQIMKRLNKLP